MTAAPEILALRRRLMMSVYGAEGVLIAVVLIVGARLAQQGSLLDAAPLAAVAAAEGLRPGLSAFAPRLPIMPRAVALGVLGLLSLASAETLAVGLEGLLEARVHAVSEARASVAAARNELEAANAEHDRLAAEEAAAAKTLADLTAHPAALVIIPHVQAQTCRGRRGSYDCSQYGAADAAARANAQAMAAYDDRVKRAQDALAQARKAAASISTKAASEAVRAAEGRYRDAVSDSPMSRLAEALFGGSLSESGFQKFKGFVTVSLAASVALGITAVAYLANIELSPAKREGKFMRALRAYLARRRRRLVRIVEKPVEIIKRKVVVRYVPVGRDGRPLDEGLRVVPGGKK